jgi:exopolysaccharide biosynthesis WecB/TagA/CpsF family protein
MSFAGTVYGRRVRIGGEWFDSVTEQTVAGRVLSALAANRGGRILTPNVDILRHASHSAEVRRFIADATLIVADGMPLIWASRLAGTPLPERVTGSGLIWTLSQALATAHHSIYVLGGEPTSTPLPPALVADPCATAPSSAALPSRSAAASLTSPVLFEPSSLAAPSPPFAGTHPMQPFATTLVATGTASLSGITVPLARSAADAPVAGSPFALRAAAPALAPASTGCSPNRREPTLSRAEAEAHRSGVAVTSTFDNAHRAATALSSAFPGLRVAGSHAPAFGFDRDPPAYATVLSGVIDAKPDLVYVGLGFPKQERVISDLRAALPKSWFLGCGAAINFVVGQARRAPFWMQRSGLEWAHRLAQEPARLAGRYLAHDAPYAMKLLASAAVQRRR